MKTQLLTILIILSTFTTVFAQAIVKGAIKDQNGNAISFATVVLHSKDLAVIKSTTTDERGSFILEKVKAERYLLSATAIGFEKNTSAVFEVKNELVETPDLILKVSPTQLSEVQVVTKRPFSSTQAI